MPCERAWDFPMDNAATIIGLKHEDEAVRIVSGGYSSKVWGADLKT